MDQLASRLQDVAESGIYQLNCAPESVRIAAEQVGFTLLEVDLSAVHGKGALLAALAQAVRAPEWFGNNWDALADALGDLSWLSAPGYVLMLGHGEEHFGLNDSDYDTLQAILTDTVAFWASQGKPFWIFICA
jgi:hypothetical protein